MKKIKIPKELKKDQTRFDKNIAALVKNGKGHKIKEEVHHKVKAGDRRKEYHMQLLDNEQAFVEQQEFIREKLGPTNYIKGTHAVHKERIAKLNTSIFWFTLFFILLPIVYVAVIYFYDLYTG